MKCGKISDTNTVTIVEQKWKLVTITAQGAAKRLPKPNSVSYAESNSLSAQNFALGVDLSNPYPKT